MSNKSVTAAGFWYTVGNILIKGLSFLTLPIFTRLMSLSDYGLYTTYVAYESIIVIIISLGLYASLKSANIEFPEKISEYVSSISLIPVFTTVVIIALSAFFLDSLTYLMGFGYIFVLLMVLQALASSLLNMYNARISLSYSYKSYLLISFLSSVGNIGLSLILILFILKDDAFAGRVWGTFLPTFCLGVFALIYFFKQSKPSFNKKYLTFGLKYSLPLVPHGLSQLTLAQFGKIIIQNKIGNEAAGVYGFAYTIALIPQIIVQSLALAWGPWFFENYAAGKMDIIKKRSSEYIAVFSLIIIILICLSPEIVKVMSDKSYWGSIDIVGYALLGVYFTFLYGLPAEVEYYYQKTNFLAIGTILSAVFNVILCLMLIPKYGYEYAVYVTVLTYILYFIFHMIVAHKISNKQLPFELRTMFNYAAVVIGVSVMNTYLSDMWYLRYLMLLIIGGIICLLNRDRLVGIIKNRSI